MGLEITRDSQRAWVNDNLSLLFLPACYIYASPKRVIASHTTQVTPAHEAISHKLQRRYGKTVWKVRF